MKKILALTSLIFALSVGATAMAADVYPVPNNKIDGVTHTNPEATPYSTVLIQDSNGKIVYVDQADGNTFGSTFEMKLMKNLDDGDYTVKLAGAGLASKTYTLKLESGSGSTDPVREFEMTQERSNSYEHGTNIAYSASINSTVNKVKFTWTEDGEPKTAYLGFKNTPEITGPTADCVVLVQSVPATVTNLKVALVNVTESN